MTESRFNPGDVIIDELTVVCARGVFDMKHSLISADVYESIFKPGVYAEFKILDTDDALGGIILSGDETLTFTFRKLYSFQNVRKVGDPSGKIPDGDLPDEFGDPSLIATYVFSLNSVKLVQGSGGLQKARTYNIEGVSPEVISSRSGSIQKAWRAPASSVVADTFKSFLGSRRPLFIEPSAGAQHLIARSVKPFNWIDQVRRRAVSTKGPSPYMFFENRDGYHLETLNGMMEAGTSKTYKQTDTVGMRLETDVDHNILNFTIVSQANAEARARMGAANHRVTTMDMISKTTIAKTIQGASPWNSPLFIAALKGVGMETYMPVTGKIPKTGIPEASPGTFQNAADHLQLIVMCRVLGEPALQAGKTVGLLIPAQVSVTGNAQLDAVISDGRGGPGKFLMTKVRHHIGHGAARPRYQTTFEAAKPGIGGVSE